ncbi:MAG: acetyl-CoA carboxylase biotin carboxyl carrier protein, partial [Candidatus Kapabacteria bacterium]|nr:acetyl-CoA carboxylase biotin carboxyl carrier protein [Candidatus Kapabacteria bacterium]
MDLKYFEKIVKIFDDSSASEFSIEEEGLKIYISAKLDEAEYPQQVPAYAPPMPQHLAAPAPAAAPIQQATPAAEATPSDNALDGTVEITTPMVGTFYAAPSPEAGPYVKVGSHISVGDTVCIVEAMKLMNEIESEVSGTIVKIVGENGKPVEFGQLLFI